jgi:uncharacterized protein (TIGR03437 family)
MSSRFRSTIAVLLVLSGVGVARAQTFDNSNNRALRGNYFIWELALSSFFNNGAFGQARSLYGVINFDGSGNYQFDGQLNDTSVSGGAQPYSTHGKYAVASSGMTQIQPFLDPGLVNADRRIYGAVSQGIFIGSSTESALNDIVIAIPAGISTSTGSVKGNFQVGSLNFLQASPTLARDAFLTLSADGNGNFSGITVNGSAVNLGSSNQTQTINGASYTMGANGIGTATFPAATSGDATNQLFTGDKVLFVSNDGNYVLGGDPNGFDIFVGIRPVSSAADNTLFQGIYYVAGLEDDASNLSSSGGFSDIASFYGSAFAFGDGNVIYHRRENSVFYGVYDFTYNGSYDIASDGTVTQNSFFFAFGLTGQVALIVGQADEYYLSLALLPQGLSPGGSVVVNPLGVVNAGSLVPITNPVAPNELVSIFGNNLASGAVKAGKGQLPKSLGGVKVMVNKRPAPIASVSPTQVNVIVPSATVEDYATFQVINNGTASNPVTVYVSPTSPGVFTQGPNGFGPGMVFHTNMSQVTSQHPAKVGETLIALVDGLGATSHAPADGAPGPSNPRSAVTGDMIVLTDGKTIIPADVSFAGLAPGLAGQYEVIFTVPQGTSSGDVYLDIATPTAYHSQATFSVQ